MIGGGFPAAKQGMSASSPLLAQTVEEELDRKKGARRVLEPGEVNKIVYSVTKRSNELYLRFLKAYMFGYHFNFDFFLR